MNSQLAFAATLTLVFGAFALLTYLCIRAVAWARKRKSGGVATDFLSGIEIGSALNPAQEVVREKRRLKRSQEGSGDRDRRD